MSNLQIVFANGDTANRRNLQNYFDRVFVAEDSSKFAVNLDHIWATGYARKDTAVRLLRSGYTEGIDYELGLIKSQRLVGGTTEHKYMLSREAAIRFCGAAKPVRQQEAKRGTYFLACKQAKAVKIGMTVDLDARVHTLQAGNPFRLHILLFLPFNIEKKLHKKFAHLSIGREWFSLSDEILAFIEGVKTGVMLAELTQ